MKCKRCGKDRVMFISAKCSDLCCAEYHGIKHNGYVPRGIGVDDFDDYVQMNFCLECGQIQGDWPIPEPSIADWTGYKDPCAND